MAKKTPAKKPSAKAPAKKAASGAPKAKAAAKAPAKGAKPASKPAKGGAKAAAPAKESKKTTKAGEAAAAPKKGEPKAKAAATKAPKKGAAAKAEPKAAPKAAAKPAKAETKAAKAPSSKKGASKSGADSQRAPGQAFLAEPGPRFRSPFASSSSSAKEAAARMAEAAGLTAIRAASTTRAPVVRKFKKITETPLPDKQLEEFRDLLIEKRDQLVGDVSSMEKEALGGDGGSLSRLPQHMADQGTDTYDQSLNLDLAASQRGIVKEIDAALSRIALRTYGVCELLGKPIGIERLRNAPWTRYSIEAARMLELNPELARVGSGVGADSDDEDSDDEV